MIARVKIELKKEFGVIFFLLVVAFLIFLFPSVAALSLGQDEKVFFDLTVAFIYLFLIIFAVVSSRSIKRNAFLLIAADLILLGWAEFIFWHSYGRFMLPLLQSGAMILLESFIFVLLRLFLFRRNNKFGAKIFFTFIMLSIFASLNLFKYNIENSMLYNAGLNRAAGDISWLLTVQYFGNLANKPYPKLDSHLKTTRILDPYFCYPYSFGILAYPEQESSKAVAFGKSGLRYCPDDWRIPYFLGITYHRQGDKQTAGKYFKKAAGKSSSPAELRDFLANYLKANNLDGNSRR